ncbi:hypothetical protein [Chitinophaga sp. XS-30]|uniref:hypothetical protein n=1 Tax=Chitinophaga sp. XS-30 TaxID=2604421 RepID=UPI0011DDB513|nr:hypothetical protein [Chitinophaga sp. XS-30]QEH43592.1 hypothetical protein FW415_23150 [Chitinophaga sp. XS-30]
MKPSFHFSFLSDAEQITPQTTLQSFCHRNSLSDLRKLLHTWLSETLSANDTIYDDTHHRADLLYLYNELHRLLDTVFLQYDQ